MNYERHDPELELLGTVNRARPEAVEPTVLGPEKRGRIRDSVVSLVLLETDTIMFSACKV